MSEVVDFTTVVMVLRKVRIKVMILVRLRKSTGVGQRSQDSPGTSSEVYVRGLESGGN